MKVCTTLSIAAVLMVTLLARCVLAQPLSGGYSTFEYLASPLGPREAPGTIVTVNVYLDEVDVLGNSLLENYGGLASAGVGIIRTKGTGATIIGATPDTADFTGPSAQSVFDGMAWFTERVDPNATHGVQTGNGPPPWPEQHGDESVFLGQFTIAVNSTETTEFDIVPKGTGGGNTLDYKGDDLDITTNQGGVDYQGAADPRFGHYGFALNLPQFPEPTSLSMLGIATLAVLPRRRRME